jgi:hypothetical protein
MKTDAAREEKARKVKTKFTWEKYLIPGKRPKKQQWNLLGT